MQRRQGQHCTIHQVCAIIAVVLLTVGSTSISKAEESIVLKGAIVTSPGGIFYEGTSKFAQLLEEKSNGRIKTELYHSGALGGERDIIEGLGMGSIDYAYTAAAPLAGFVPEFNLLELPYLAENAEAIEAKLDGPFGDQLFVLLDKIGIVGLGFFDAGYRQMETEKPVKGLEDMRGLKIRVMESPVFLDTFKALGALPTPMSFTEIYTALEQGVIDGIEVPYSPFWSAKFYEVAKNITKTQHSFTINPLMMSKQTFNKLSPELQEIVLECGRDATIFERQLREKADRELEAKFKSAGVTIYEVDLAEFMQACKPVRDSYLKKYPEELTKYLQ